MYAVSVLVTLLFSSFTCGRAQSTNEQYDFIIVGGGSAGSVLANRLTEIPTIRVLLLEAGQNETLESEVPLLAGTLQLTPLDWNYTSTRQNNSCLGCNNQTCLWPSGRVLGGSSVLNYMIYVRGNRKDYNRWAKLGNVGWDWKGVFPYFMKLENYTGNITQSNTKYHSVGGPLTVGYVPYHTVLADSFVQAGNENGYQTDDYNAATQTGVQLIEATIRNGQRCSTNKAYLWPIVNTRSNFVLKTGAQAQKILLDVNNTAYGVEYIVNGQKYTATVTKEVLVSAGALNSPQLLMVSGIGPQNELAKFNIPMKVQSEGVGQNFQDHVACGGIEWLIDQPLSLVNSRVINNQTQAEWTNFGNGPLTIPAQVEATAFINTNPQKKNLDYPDIQLFYFSGSPASDGGTGERYTIGFTDDVWNGYYQPIVNRDTYSIYPVLLRPESRGSITLQSASMLDAPLIDPAYYTDAKNKDISTMVKGVKLALQFGNANAWSQYNSTFHNATFPTCTSVPYQSDAYWECLARSFISINFHPASSCTMGVRNVTPNAVVDPRLRVYGVTNLRVIDASIMPLVTSGNTNGPTIMIAEKGADMIKLDWGLPLNNTNANQA